MSKLGEALQGAPLPDSERARERAIAVAAATAVGEDSGRSRRRFLGWPWSRPAWVAALAGATLVAVLFSLTPPGRAIAGDLGRLVGIGDEPTEGVAPGEQAVVIGSDEAVRSYPFEIVATTNLNGQPNEETCIDVQFPSANPLVTGGNCLTGNRSAPLSEYASNPMVNPAPDAFAPDAELVVQGMLPLGATVAVDYTKTDGTEGSADIHYADLNDALGDKIGVADRASYFVSVLPSGILHGSVVHPDELTLSPSASRSSRFTIALSPRTAARSPTLHSVTTDGL